MRETSADSSQPSTYPPEFGGPFAVAQPAADASHPAPAGAGHGSAPRGISPSTPAIGPSAADHSPAPGIVEMLRQTPPKAHVRLLRRFQVVGWAPDTLD